MKPSSDLKKRTAWYILGLNLIAAAVVLNIRYNVGVAAFSSVMYAISEIYHISLGTASILCYLLFVVLQCILSRKITLTYLLEIPLSFAFGILTDVYDWLIPVLPFPLPLRLLCFALTMFITGAAWRSGSSPPALTPSAKKPITKSFCAVCATSRNDVCRRRFSYPICTTADLRLCGNSIL